MVSPCLLNFYAVHHVRFWAGWLTSWNQSSWIVRRNINNLRYAENTMLMIENAGKLKSLLMKVKEESEKTSLKLSIQKAKIMASGPITSWQIDEGKVETVTDFLFLGSKITADSDCCHEIKRHLLLRRKAITNLVKVLKSQTSLCWHSSQALIELDSSITHSFDIVKAVIFPVVMYRCESWTINKAEHQRINASELWCWRTLLRVPWTARRSNH